MEQNIDERSSVPKAEQAKGVAQPLHSPMIQRWVVPEPGRVPYPWGSRLRCYRRNHFRPAVKHSGNKGGLRCRLRRKRGSIMIAAILNLIYRQYVRTSIYGAKVAGA
jgi:hypothetical protein